MPCQRRKQLLCPGTTSDSFAKLAQLVALFTLSWGLKEQVSRSQDTDCYLSAESSQQHNSTRAQQLRQMQAASEGPDISQLSPILQRQWMHDRNKHLGSIKVKPYSSRKAWWSCPDCPDGHSHIWEATVGSRTKGRGCQFCSGNKVCKHNSLATKAPEAAHDWHTDRNLPLSPETVTAQSNVRALWCCAACQHEWLTRIQVRVIRGCPKCAKAHAGSSKDGMRQKHPTFASCNHPLLAQWNHGLNAREGNYPENTTLGSNKLIWWDCKNCPKGRKHVWQAKPFQRAGTAQSSCPFCAGKKVCACNSLQTVYPEVAVDFDIKANQLTPDQVTRSPHPEYRWLSDKPETPLRITELRRKRRVATQP